MALTKIGKEGITGISNSANANAITIDSSENIGIGGALNVQGETTLQTHLNMGDNDKIKLGASGDLEIYHDESNSYVDDTGTGRLYLRGNARVQIQKYTGEDMVTAIADGAVNLYYDNAKKFETTSGGVTVTGGVTSSSTYVGTASGSAAAPNFAVTSGSLGANGMFVPSANTLGFGTSATERMRISSGGNVMIGTTTEGVAGADELTVGNTSAGNGITIRSGTSNSGALYFSDGTSGSSEYDGGFEYSHGSQFMRFISAGSERMRISSAGKLGIGATTIDSDIHIEKAADLEIKLERTGSGTSTIGVPSSGQLLINNTSNADMILSTNNTERLRIKNGGNVLVGTTNQSPAEGTTVGVRLGGNGTSQFSSAGDAMDVNRTTDYGDIIRFRYNGSVVGSIGTNGSFGIGAAGDTGFYIASNLDAIIPCSPTAGFTNRDGAIDIGYSTVRFRHAYFTGSFTSSDRNEKQDIEDLTETEKKVATKCKGLIKKFRYKDRVAEKGDGARIHIGVIAQELKEAFSSEGLDAHRYSIYSETTWWEKEISVDAVKEDKANNIEAKDAYTYMDQKYEKTDGYTERTRCMVNYDELLAFIISAL